MNNGPAGLRLRRTLVLAALALAMVISLWGPIVPTAEAEPASLTASEELSIPGLTDPPWRVWHTETVKDRPGLPGPEGFEDEGSVSGSGINVEMAPDGMPRLLFGWLPPGQVVDILYAWPEDGEWRFDQIEHKAQPDGFALDEEGDPWITWLKEGETFVATRNGTDEEWWRMQLADDGREPRIEIGPQGLVHLFMADTGPRPTPAEHGVFDPDRPGDGWTVTDVGGDVLGWIDMSVDSQGTPHGVWRDTDGTVKYATEASEGWRVETVSACSARSAIAIGPSDRPHVACHARGGPWGVVHAVRQPDGSWESEVASDGSQLVPPRGTNPLGRSTDIAVDEAGRAHIAFATISNPFFRDDPTRPARPVYAVNANGPCPDVLDEAGVGSVDRSQNPCTDWHVQAVDHDGTNTALTTDVTLDEDGVPSLAYTTWFRTDARGCHEVVNPCWDVRLATPWVGELGVGS